jgi:hypothetical protein
MTQINRLVAIWLVITALALAGIWVVKVLAAHLTAPWARGLQSLVGAV